MPLAKVPKEFKTRFYLGNVKIPDIDQTFQSHVFYSDLPKNNILQNTPIYMSGVQGFSVSSKYVQESQF